MQCSRDLQPNQRMCFRISKSGIAFHSFVARLIAWAVFIGFDMRNCASKSLNTSAPRIDVRFEHHPSPAESAVWRVIRDVQPSFDQGATQTVFFSNRSLRKPPGADAWQQPFGAWTTAHQRPFSSLSDSYWKHSAISHFRKKMFFCERAKNNPNYAKKQTWNIEQLASRCSL